MGSASLSLALTKVGAKSAQSLDLPQAVVRVGQDVGDLNRLGLCWSDLPGFFGPRLARDGVPCFMHVLLAEKPPLPSDEASARRIKALMTENRNLKAKVRHLEQHLEDVGGMPRKTESAIWKCLHPDQEAQRDRGGQGRCVQAVQRLDGQQGQGTTQSPLTASLPPASMPRAGPAEAADELLAGLVALC